MMPKVSVCIPAYKQAALLKRAIDSVLGQTYSDFEVVVTDDTPDDSVTEVIAAFDSEKIRYFKNSQRQGSPGNWNESIRRSSGEYIKILHHDDWLRDSESLGRYVAMLNQNPDADFAFSATIVSSHKRNTERLFSLSASKLAKIRKSRNNLFFANWVGAPSATIYRGSVGLQFDERMKWLVDVDFYLRALEKNPKFVYCTEPLINTTDEAPHQVTSECLTDKSLQLFENIYLFRKLYSDAAFSARLFMFFWRLLRRYDVASADEILAAGVEAPLPLVVKRALGLRKIENLFGLKTAGAR